MSDIIKACLITGGSMFGLFILIIGIILLIIINPFKRKCKRPMTIKQRLYDKQILQVNKVDKIDKNLDITVIGSRVKENSNKIMTGEYLEIGDYIKSDNDKYFFILNKDGTLCLMEDMDGSGNVYSCINNPNPKIKYGIMDKSGNFILTDDEKNIIFETKTNKENSYVKLIDDGIVGIYDKYDNLIYTFIGDLKN
jgi:hypothetical protein